MPETPAMADQDDDKPSPPNIRFAWRDWLPYLEDSDATEAEKQELIETVWAIVTAFVDMGWSVNPTQQICGQEIDLKAVLERAVIGSDQAAAMVEQEEDAA